VALVAATLRLAPAAVKNNELEVTPLRTFNSYFFFFLSNSSSQLYQFLNIVLTFSLGAATTKAGLQRFIAENQHKEIIIIDEIDKMPLQHQEGLLTIMERGEFTTTKVRNTKTVRANVVIFATSNSTE
jgi:hypothetical protein